MLDENKEKQSIDCKPNDLLMKPFALGWTREVVNRVITKNRNLSCDIYYFSPSGKKIRSLTEIRSNLPDGLTPECFSFKRQPLGVNENFETVRNARIKRKGNELSDSKSKLPKANQRISSANCGTAVNEIKTVKEAVKSKKKSSVKKKKNLEDEVAGAYNEKVKDNKSSEVKIRKSVITKSKKINNLESTTEGENSLHNNVIKKTTKYSVRLEAARKSELLKKMMAAKQEKQCKVAASKKILEKHIRKKVAKSTKPRVKTEKDTGLKKKNFKGKICCVTKNTSKILKCHPTINKKEDTKTENFSTELDKKPTGRDLRSIVKTNIGKYREMREKQKLANKSQINNTKSRVVIRTNSRKRSEPISKNKQLYLKPLEKGWRRELVFRTNCAKAGQHADVYYFHPNGKKLRSTREVAENLTSGLAIECFTFRKEPIGCGEPSEVIRKARLQNKFLQSV